MINLLYENIDEKEMNILSRRATKYVLSTYFVSWFIWVILAFLSIYKGFKFGELGFMILFVLGGLGPFYTALIINYRLKDKQEFKAFIKKIFMWKVNPLWYLVIFFVPFILFSIPWLKYSLLCGNTVPLFRQKVIIIFLLIPMNILLGGLEEVGWRGILLPELTKKFSKILATIITSIIWSMWHLPLWFIKSSPQENMNIVFFIILGLCFSFLLTIIYTKTESIFLCIILHSIFNSYPNIINMPIQNLYIDSLIMLTFTIIIFLIFENNIFLKSNSLVKD